MSYRSAALVAVIVLASLPLAPIHAFDQLITPVYDNVVYFASVTQVVAAGGTIIDDYGGFVTAWLTETQASALRSQGAVVRLIDHNMGLGAYYGDWKLSPPTVPAALRAATSSPMYVVQFRGPIRESWLDSVENNTEAVYRYVPNNALLVNVSATQRTVLSALPYVRHLEPFHPGLKLGLRLPTNGTHVYDALVHADANRTLAASSIIAAGAELELQLTTGAVGNHVIRFIAEPSEAQAIAGLPAVFAVDVTEVEIRVATQRSSAKLQTNHTVAAGAGTSSDYRIHSRGVNGSSQIVGDCDNGIETTTQSGGALRIAHVSLYDDGTFQFPNGSLSQPDILFNQPSPLHRKVHLFYAPQFPPNVYHGDGQDSPVGDGWHGTMTSNILVGDSRVLGGTTGWDERNGEDGVAFAARLAMCDFHVTNPTLHEVIDINTGQALLDQHYLDVHNYGIPDPAAYFEPGYSVGARVFSNSWGSGRLITPAANPVPLTNGPSYTIGSHLADAYIHARPNLTMVFAAGNLGGDAGKTINGIELSGPTPGLFQPEALAKNVIGAGAVNEAQTRVEEFSSWSPCTAPAIKPDLVAQGGQVKSAKGGDEPEPSVRYTTSSGTSYSTPGLAGAAALVRDFLAKGNYSGSALDANASLVRAMLVASARAVPDEGRATTDPRKCSVFPNGVQGWGMPVLDNVLKFPGDAENVTLWDENASRTITGAGSTWTQAITIDRTKQLRVVLAWTDEAGLPYSPNPLVNDLDLVLVLPNGTKIIANDRLNTGLPDIRNTIEAIHLPAPSETNYTIRVEGRNLPVLNQKFSLVLLNGPEASS